MSRCRVSANSRWVRASVSLNGPVATRTEAGGGVDGSGGVGGVGGGVGVGAGGGVAGAGGGPAGGGGVAGVKSGKAMGGDLPFQPSVREWTKGGKPPF